MSAIAPTVFVVDDDNSTRELLAWLMKRNGLAFEAFPDARSFLEAYDTERPGCLDGLGGDVAHATLDEADDDGECVENTGDNPWDDRNRHQIDERDDVDELRQRLQHVVDRPQALRDSVALGREDPE